MLFCFIFIDIMFTIQMKYYFYIKKSVIDFCFLEAANFLSNIFSTLQREFKNSSGMGMSVEQEYILSSHIASLSSFRVIVRGAGAVSNSSSEVT